MNPKDMNSQFGNFEKHMASELRDRDRRVSALQASAQQWPLFSRKQNHENQLETLLR